MTAATVRWRGTDVTVAEVVSRLAAVQLAAARNQLAEGAIHPRNSVLDLIVVASRPADADRAARVVRGLALHHPCRALVILDRPGETTSRIDASLTSLDHHLMNGSVCQYEEVYLRVQGPAAEHIPSLVEALLIPDVVTYIWWTGAAPLGEPRFESALQAADVTLVDSARFARPGEALATLAGLAGAARPIAFGDLQWVRLQRWREALAQFFNPADRRVHLRRIRRVEINHAAGGSGNRSGAALLAGWLAAALGWKVEGTRAGRGGRLTAQLASPSTGRIELVLHPMAFPGTVPGEVTAIRVESSSQSGPGDGCVLSAARDRRHPDDVVVEADIRGSRVPSLVISCPPERDADLLSRLLVAARGDTVFPAALMLAAKMTASPPR